MSASTSIPVLVFLHLPKAAGSTLLSILKRQYPAGSVLELYESSFGDELASMPQESIDHCKLITGHLYYGIHTLFPRPVEYITLLRDPVERVTSHYSFVQRHPEHYLYPVAKEKSLQEYIQFCGRAEPNNDQTRLLAGLDHATRAGLYTSEMLPAAKENLAGHFRAAGIAEEFDRSLLLMRRMFGWKSAFYTRRNVSPRRSRQETVSAEALWAIQEYNQLDIELYSYAKSLFEQQVQAQGEALERELRQFQALNRLYNHLSKLASPAVGKWRKVWA